MNTVFGILLVIGKILLVILLILLLILAAVLFIPVRYKALIDGSTERSGLHVNAEVSWCLRMLILRVDRSVGKEQEGAGQGRKFLVFGISPSDLRAKRRKKQKEAVKAAKKRQLETIRAADPEKYDRLKEEAKARKEEREARRRQKAEEDAARREREKEELAAAEERRERMRIRALHSIGYAERAFRAVLSAFTDAFGLIYRVFLAICELPLLLCEKTGSFMSGLLAYFGRIMNWIDFLTDPRTSGAVMKAWKLLKKLLGHILPGDADGSLTYGFGDPSLTGESLAVLAAFYPRYAGRINISPQFDAALCEAELTFKGRVRIAYIVYLLINGICDSDIRYMIHLYREHKKEEEKQ